MNSLKKLKKLLKKPKLSSKDFDKIGSTINEIKDCPYCLDLKNENKECMEEHNVKNDLRSITNHQIKCKDCRARVLMITECKKKGHR